MKIKRKGVYEYELAWHQNHSQLIVPKAAEAALVHNVDIMSFITSHTDIFDFMLRTKVKRSDKLMLNGTQQLQNITRYYVSKSGGSLAKVSPPVKGHKVGDWKRANGLTDELYDRVVRELGPSPPWDERINTKNKSKYEQRETSIHVGWLVTPCNDIKDANWSDINFDYYIAETNKLVEGLVR